MENTENEKININHEYENNKEELNENNKKNRIQKNKDFKINSGNVAIISSSLSLVISAINKLLRMLVLVTGGLIIFLYILSALLSFFALYSCIKNSIKNKQITVDSFFCGISILILIFV